MNPTEVLLKYNKFAVVGASAYKKKYGYKIFKTIINYGKIGYPITRRYKDIEGIPCFSSISELPERPDVVVAVIPPRATDVLIDECKEVGVNILWLQPGTYNESTLQKCKDVGIEAVYGACIMLKLQEG